MLPPAGIAARFADETFETGVTALKTYSVYSVFNRADTPAERSIVLPPGKYRLVDVWTGEALGVFDKTYHLPPLPAHSARLIKAEKVQ